MPTVNLIKDQTETHHLAFQKILGLILFTQQDHQPKNIKL